MCTQSWLPIGIQRVCPAWIVFWFLRLYAHWSADWISDDDAGSTSRVTGRCSPYDNDVNPEDSEQITDSGRLVDNGVCPGVMNRVTGRCSPYDANGALITPSLDASTSAYFASHLSIVGCFWSWWRTQLPPQLLTLTSGHVVVPENTSALMPNGWMCPKIWLLSSLPPSTCEYLWSQCISLFFI